MGDSDFLTAREILDAADLTTEDVVVPEWGGKKVRVREAMSMEWEEYTHSLFLARSSEDKEVAKKAAGNATSTLVGNCVIKEDGSRMFTDDQIRRLGLKSTAAITRLYRRIIALSAATKEGVVEIEKNSGPGKSTDSPTPLPGT